MIIEILQVGLLPTVVCVIGLVIARAIKKHPQVKVSKLDFSEKE